MRSGENHLFSLRPPNAPADEGPDVAPETVGNGVARATNTLVDMQKVRFVVKMESYQGKLYYILTAFPEL